MTLLQRFRRYRAIITIYGCAWDAMQCGLTNLAHEIWRMGTEMEKMPDTFDPDQFAAKLRWIANAKAGSLAAC